MAQFFCTCGYDPCICRQYRTQTVEQVRAQEFIEQINRDRPGIVDRLVVELIRKGIMVPLVVAAIDYGIWNQARSRAAGVRRGAGGDEVRIGKDGAARSLTACLFVIRLRGPEHIQIELPSEVESLPRPGDYCALPGLPCSVQVKQVLHRLDIQPAIAVRLFPINVPSLDAVLIPALLEGWQYHAWDTAPMGIGCAVPEDD